MTGTVVNGTYLNTDSGLTAPGGFFDRLTNTIDQVSQSNAQLSGIAPALRDTGVPLPAQSPGIFSRMFGAAGLAPAPDASAAPAMPPMQAPADPNAPAAPSATSPLSGLMSYVGQAAKARGIDPMTAIHVAMSEGGASGGYGASGTGDGGSSFSPFQLHYGGVAGGGNSVAGLGDDFTAATGKDARDPANAKAAIDFALDHAAKNGWGAFHGASKAGISPFAGIIQGPPQASIAPTPLPPGAQSAAVAPAGQSPSQPGPMPVATASPSVGGGQMQPTAPAAPGTSSCTRRWPARTSRRSTRLPPN